MLLLVALDIDTTQTQLPLDDARARLVAAVAALSDEPVAVATLTGRVLSRPVNAPGDVPAWANSALDGYAVRAADAAAGSLPVVFDVPAGADPPPLPAAAAVRIATGGVLPVGADSVLAIENAAEVDGVVRATNGPPALGNGVRRAGADIARGVQVLPAGRMIRPLDAAAVAVVGLAEAWCARRPRAVVLTTGDELVSPGEPLRRGQVHDSNTTLVSATLAEFGCSVTISGRIPDTRQATERFLRGALDADLVVTTGGVSVGPRDHVKPALAALGVDELFWRVAIQPGKPVWAGRHRDGALVIGLPGNPLSALAGLHLLVRPAVDAMLGRPAPEPWIVELAEPVTRLAIRTRALPASIRDGRATPLAEASHQIARAALADVLVLIGPGTGAVTVGERVAAIAIRR
jgi:molybdopterin molybdotransferase